MFCRYGIICFANTQTLNSPLPDHGSVGTSAVWATKLDAILSPNAHIAFSDGPMKEMLFLWSNSGNFGFSDA
jgi:hypothetical protein